MAIFIILILIIKNSCQVKKSLKKEVQNSRAGTLREDEDKKIQSFELKEKFIDKTNSKITYVREDKQSNKSLIE